MLAGHSSTKFNCTDVLELTEVFNYTMHHLPTWWTNTMQCVASSADQAVPLFADIERSARLDWGWEKSEYRTTSP